MRTYSGHAVFIDGDGAEYDVTVRLSDHGRRWDGRVEFADLSGADAAFESHGSFLELPDGSRAKVLVTDVEGPFCDLQGAGPPPF